MTQQRIGDRWRTDPVHAGVRGADLGRQQQRVLLPRSVEGGRVVLDDRAGRIAKRRREIVPDEDRDDHVGMFGPQDLLRLREPIDRAGQQSRPEVRVQRCFDPHLSQAVGDRARSLHHERIADQRHPMHPRRSERQPMTRLHDGRTVHPRIRRTRPSPPPIPRHETRRDETHDHDHADQSSQTTQGPSLPRPTIRPSRRPIRPSPLAVAAESCDREPFPFGRLYDCPVRKSASSSAAGSAAPSRPARSATSANHTPKASTRSSFCGAAPPSPVTS